MAYAIMRCKKLTGMGSAAAALQHCYRERDTPNADPSQTPQNEHHAARSSDEAMGRLRELLPDKRRKDAVLAVEYVMTASPEWWAKASPQQQQAFFQRSRQWLVEKYGEDRVITATVHRDETSPHLSAFVVPLTKDGRLSAKEFIGNKTMMNRDQTTYAEMVRDLGLQRGLEGSRMHHTTIQKYYARANAAMPARTPPMALPEPKLLESKAAYGVRTAQAVIDQMEPEVAILRAKADQVALAENRAIVAEQRRKEAEILYLQREKLLRLEVEKVNELTRSERNLKVAIANGGEPLLQLQKEIRERLDNARQKNGIKR